MQLFFNLGAVDCLLYFFVKRRPTLVWCGWAPARRVARRRRSDAHDAAGCIEHGDLRGNRIECGGDKVVSTASARSARFLVVAAYCSANECACRVPNAYRLATQHVKQREVVGVKALRPARARQARR